MTNLINRKKGETVHMYAFTGMHLGEFTITGADKTTVSITQKNGRVTKFDRETGKQLDAKTPRCASRITEEEEVPKTKKSKSDEAPAKRSVKKIAKKKVEVEPEEEDEYEEV